MDHLKPPFLHYNSIPLIARFRDRSIVFFGSEDSWKKGWDEAHAKWKTLGAKHIDLHIAPGQAHSFFNKEPWRTLTLIAADQFLVKQGLLTGEPNLQSPGTGEKLAPAPKK